MEARTTGLVVIVLGVAVVVVGAAIYLGWFSWFGNLPGDIRVEKPGFRLYVPIVSMVVISVVLTLVVNLLRRLL